MRKPQDYQVGITSKKQEKLNRQVYRQSGQEAKDLKKASKAKRTGEVQESFIWGTLLNTTTYMVIFFLLIFGSSITEYQKEPDKYSWLDLNDKGEIVGFKEETYDVTVSYNLDTPLDELNGYSLREAFEDENEVVNGFGNSVVGWTVTGNAILSSENGRLRLASRTLNYPYAYQMIYVSSGNVIYSRIDAFVGTGEISFRYYDTWNSLQIWRVNSSVDTSFSFLETMLYSGNGLFSIHNDTTTNYTYTEYDNIIFLNLTDLGINQTKDEMDYWYSEYQRLQENRIEDMKHLGGEVVSSWYTTTQILMQIGDVIETIYDNSPVSWIIDLFADIGV